MEDQVEVKIETPTHNLSRDQFGNSRESLKLEELEDIPSDEVFLNLTGNTQESDFSYGQTYAWDNYLARTPLATPPTNHTFQAMAEGLDPNKK